MKDSNLCMNNNGLNTFKGQDRTTNNMRHNIRIIPNTLCTITFSQDIKAQL